MVTTIQVSDKLKNTLSLMKESSSQSYEQVILQIIRTLEEQKRKHVDFMIEGAKETAEESLKITREFEAIEEDFDWEWKDGD